jgi:hypothetical protein
MERGGRGRGCVSSKATSPRSCAVGQCPVGAPLSIIRGRPRCRELEVTSEEELGRWTEEEGRRRGAGGNKPKAHISQSSLVSS